MSDVPSDDKRRTACLIAMLELIAPRRRRTAPEAFADMLAKLKDYDASMQRELEEARARIAELEREQKLFGVQIDALTARVGERLDKREDPLRKRIAELEAGQANAAVEALREAALRLPGEFRSVEADRLSSAADWLEAQAKSPREAESIGEYAATRYGITVTPATPEK